jgi:thymidylate synthase (FAD)
MEYMKVKLMRITENPEELIEFAGRTCYQSHDKGPNPLVIAGWIRAAHESVIEHCVATFNIEDVSISLMKQLIRHRIASFSIMSYRYNNMSEFDYVVPESIQEDKRLLELFKGFMDSAHQMYRTLTDHGIKKEDARSVIPESSATKIVLTMNFRELRHFFKLRLDPASQLEIRRLAGAMFDIVYAYAPNVFKDIGEKYGRI